MEQDKTLAGQASFRGIGLHTGCQASLTLNPAPLGTGIRFVRTDLLGKPMVMADLTFLKDSERGVTLSKGEAKVSSVEHLLASLAAFGITNVIVEVFGEELPSGDGSALPYVKLIKEAGIVVQERERRFQEIRSPLWFSEGNVSLVALPYNGLKISYTLDYSPFPPGVQYASFEINADIFEREIAPARTFCLYREVESLREKGLIKGGSLENAIVIGDEGVINTSLRFENEPVRHKILDLMGDLALLGTFVKAHIVAIKSGHSSNLKLVEKIRRAAKIKEEGAVNIVREEEVPSLDRSKELGLNEIQKILPHRYPFLFVDKILKIEENKRAVGMKNVTYNEYFFRGHFPGHPIMPGVLIVEAMAQVAGVLVLGKPENRGKLIYFLGLDNVKFRRPVFPGDQLRIEVEVAKLKSRLGVVLGKAFVEDKLVAEAELKFSLAAE